MYAVYDVPGYGLETGVYAVYEVPGYGLETGVQRSTLALVR